MSIMTPPTYDVPQGPVLQESDFGTYEPEKTVLAINRAEIGKEGHMLSVDGGRPLVFHGQFMGLDESGDPVYSFMGIQFVKNQSVIR